MQELLVIGFAEKHRALEVLPQMQRLHFAWSGDLQNAVAVEVERDGRLKLFQGLLLDGGANREEVSQWKAILSAIVPPPYSSPSGSARQNAEGDVDARQERRLARFSFEDNFTRDAAAILRPGSSALLAIVRDAEEVLAVMSGFSHFVLHTRFTQL